MQVLAIETSCDDTSVAVVNSKGFVRACISANQDLQHKPFGGVVPEIASRNHTLHLLPLIEELFKQSKLNWGDIDGLVVTSRPGLIGSLLVGVVTAKTLALTLNKPLLGVNHLEGHLLAAFLQDEKFQPKEPLHFPYLALAVSGGHTQLYQVDGIGDYKILGRTLDDAAGEAFDKFAKAIGLPFPGGPKVDAESKGGNRGAFQFPRSMLNDKSLNFSFSGLKAAAIRQIEKMAAEDVTAKRADLCASYQEAVVDILIGKLKQAQDETGLKTIVITGGVSANSRFREQAEKWAEQNKLKLFIPPLRYCTNNAAMIGYVGALRLERGEQSDQSLAPLAANQPHDFKEMNS